MSTSAYAPDTQVEIAWTSNYSTPESERTWTDVSDYVLLDEGIDISGGRSDERSTTDANTCSLTFDNSDGRFTPEYASGAYYPNVRLNRPLRVVTRYPSDTVGNLLTANQASLETDVSDWDFNTLFGAYVLGAAKAQTSAFAQHGSDALLATWTASASGQFICTEVTGLVVGRTYTFSVYVRVPTGDPDPRAEVAFIATSSRTSTKNAWTRLQVTFAGPASGTAFVGVQVASAAAADVCYIDAAMVNEGSSAATFTTSAPAERTRFCGFVDEWPVAWPEDEDETCTTRVSASSRLARLGNTAKMQSVLMTEILADSPDFYFPLGEPEGSTQADSITGVAQLSMAGTGTAVAFGDEHGPATDESTAARVTYGGKQLRLPSYTFNGGDLTLECVYTATNITGGGDLILDAMYWWVPDGTHAVYARLSVDHTGGLESVTVYLDVGDSFTLTGSTPNLSDGLPHHLAVVVETATAVRLYYDGELLDSDTVGLINLPAVTPRINVMRSDSGNAGDTAVICHLAIYEAALGATRIAAHADAALNTAGETAVERLDRLGRYVGVPAAETDFDAAATMTVAHQDTTDVAAVEAMRRVETTEGGVLYDARDGTLTYDGRTQRYGASAAVSLSFDDAEVGAAVAPTYDRSALVNDATVNYALSMVESVNEASVEEYGPAVVSVDSLATTDAEAWAAASWLTSVYGEPRTRVPVLSTVDLTQLATAKLPGVLACDVGSLIEATDWPDQASASSLDFFVEGYTEQIGLESHVVAFNVSPAAIWLDVFTIDDATRGQINGPYMLGW